MPMPSTRPCTLGRNDSLAGNTENLRLDDPTLSTSSAGRGTTMGIKGPLSREELAKIDAYWRAANYLSVGQIYLYDNPLLKERLTTRHVKRRLLGHFGTTPGLNFVYAHLNRVIKTRDLSVIYIAGPGHGGPGLVANAYLEGTYSEVYPEVSQDEAGLKRLFTQFSFPGGIPSHHAPETPGSMHEGGELATMHQALAATLDTVVDEIGRIQHAARTRGFDWRQRPRWPMIVLRTPKGWTGPREVDGKLVEGTWRSHQVPLAGLFEKPDHVALLERWMRSYRPEELFDEHGRLRTELAALAPAGTRRMSANPP